MLTDLPPGFAARPPTPADAEVIAAAIVASEAADAGASDMTTEELLDDWHGVDLATEAVVVLTPDGRVAGYADVLDRGHVVVSVYGYVPPEQRGQGVGAYLVGWGERWARDRLPLAPEGARVVVQHYVGGGNEGAGRLLTGAGYAPVRQIWLMTIDLDQAPPPPDWPAGVVVRAFVPGRDDRACHEAVEDAFRDLWGRPPSPFERFVRMTENDTFDPSLWFLAWEGETIAGAALSKVVAGRGWVDVIGVRRPYRGRGLGLALLRQAFGAFHRRGVERVNLSVDAESATGAPRLYLRAGMRVERSFLLYRKELRSGADVVPD